jgi:hypothetical protein
MTPHETAAAAVLGSVSNRLAALTPAPHATREIDLPERCPPEGLVNLRFEDPVEVDRQLGHVARDWSRVCAVEIVVQHPDQAVRIARFEAILAAIGALHGPGNQAGGIDWLDMSGPAEAEELPVEGAATIKAGIVEMTLYYRSAGNPMEVLP